jgi:hypothetical protein
VSVELLELGEIDELDVVLGDVLEMDEVVSIERDGSAELVAGLLALVVSAKPAEPLAEALPVMVLDGELVSVELGLVSAELGVEEAVLLTLGLEEPSVEVELVELGEVLGLVLLVSDGVVELVCPLVDPAVP